MPLTAVPRALRVVVPADWPNDQRGDFLERVAASLLTRQRYRVTQRIRFTGMEIDLLADHLDTGQRAFVECKFQRDALSATAVDGLIGKAVRRQVPIAYLFSTSSPGKDAKGAIQELKDSPPPGGPVFAFVGPEDIIAMLEDSAVIPPNLLESSPRPGFSAATLVVTPFLDPFWVTEEVQQGLPSGATIVSAHNLSSEDRESITALLHDNAMYEGLTLDFPTAPPTDKPKTASTSYEDELVTPIPFADSLDDYRPCRPRDFVGRNDLQKRIWQFLDLVRDSRTTTRVLALSGPSGFGKSSVVVKTADRFRNKKWSSKYLLYPVDVRSAKGPLFVLKALRAAIQAALEAGFISGELPPVTIDSTELVLQTPSIQAALQALAEGNRVLVVFFDQFEELLSKPDLLPTFETFRRLAFELHSIRPNLVLGFSWRTGITLTDDNPAYHMWHTLSDARHELSIGGFSSAEASELVGQFEKALSQNLLPPLRRRLLEQAQGLPWLLKKLCIHIYRQIEAGATQEQLLESRLNIKALFDEDLTPLTDAEIECLRFIASQSPADLLDVHERFGEATINNLYAARLIVRTGQRYTVYWDIFRDYLVDNLVPAIPFTYIPNVELSMAIRAFVALQEDGPMDVVTLARALGYAGKTTLNTVTDLLNLIVISRDGDGLYRVRPELSEADSSALALFLRDQFKDHKLTHALRENLEPGTPFSEQQLIDVIRVAYSSSTRNQRTLSIYAKRLQPWFRFAGLLEAINDVLMLPTNEGAELGLLPASLRKPLKGEKSLLCESEPDRLEALAVDLLKQGAITRPSLLATQNRNAASDLVGLGLARWSESHLVPTSPLSDLAGSDLSKIRAEVKSRALASPFLTELSRILSQQPPLSNRAAGLVLSARLGRNWLPASAQRYASAGRRWLKAYAHPYP